MIYIVTDENHQLLEQAIEQTYQRRRRGAPRKRSYAVWRAVWINCVVLPPQDALRAGDEFRGRDGVRWLRRLESDVEKLGLETGAAPPRAKKRAVERASAARSPNPARKSAKPCAVRREKI